MYVRDREARMTVKKRVSDNEVLRMVQQGSGWIKSSERCKCINYLVF